MGKKEKEKGNERERGGRRGESSQSPRRRVKWHCEKAGVCAGKPGRTQRKKGNGQKQRMSRPLVLSCAAGGVVLSPSGNLYGCVWLCNVEVSSDPG